MKKLLTIFGFLSILSSVSARADLPFQETIIKGNMLYITGQVSLDKNFESVKDDVKSQTRRTLDIIKKHVQQSPGFTLKDLVACTIQLSDLKYSKEMNDGYQEFFKENKVNFPTRTVIGGVQIYDNLDVEITCTAQR
ncbi:MAG: hypothetical protein A4S09_05815 [Proteobacteria bacterium SG_bin7]|nr:MAG: hypothetical protein A4S09_05815 [Proteobacteria bacterium SG_bin7]